VNPPDSTLARKRRLLFIVLVALLAGGAAILVLPPRVPLPMRLFVVAGDLVAAAMIGLILRQATGSRR